MLQRVVGDVPIGDAPAESRRGLSIKRQEETETVHLLAPRLSVGANIAHAAAGAHEQVRATVVLSPGLPPPGVLRPKGSRPRAVLFASSRTEVAPVLELLGTAREPRLNILGSDAEAHGVGLLGDRRIRRAILDWLERHLAAPAKR